MIGRQVDLADLQNCISRHRLITLTGTGGIGKTRLAIEVGWRSLEHFAEGVWLIDLAPLTDPETLVSATAATLQISVRRDEGAVERIAAALAGQRRLLIFDNCENVAGAAARLVDLLLKLVPGLSILATSQDTLHVDDEQVYRLGPLAVPSAQTTEISGVASVDLFVERARAVDRRFQLDPANTAGIAEICRRLDGVPLALEMAAARVPLLGVEGVRAGLGERLRMLRNSRHVAHPRHASLQATVQWSYRLLEPQTQELFRRVAIFPGSFSLDAAVAIGGGDRSDRWDLIDTLGQLVDKSLVTVDGGGPPRYRLLETLRLFGLEQLDRSGEHDAAAERHARYFLALFEDADQAWDTTPEEAWLESHRQELDNLRAALEWTLALRGRADLAVALGGAGALLWQAMSLRAEGRRYLGRAAALIGAATPPRVAARLFRRSSSLWLEDDRRLTLEMGERAVALYRQLDDPLNLAGALAGIGGDYALLGRNNEAQAALDEARSALPANVLKRPALIIVNNLGILAVNLGNRVEARDCFARTLDMARALRATEWENIALINLAEIEFDMGDIGMAIERGREALRAARSTNDRVHYAMASVNLSEYLVLNGNLCEARTIGTDALANVGEAGGHLARSSLQQWALLGALEGRLKEAAQVLGFIDARLASTGDTRGSAGKLMNEKLTVLLNATLLPAEIEALATEGSRWDADRAMKFAIRHLVSVEATHP